MEILVNGDYHEFHFSGMAKDVIDSASFETGAAQLQAFRRSRRWRRSTIRLCRGTWGRPGWGRGHRGSARSRAATIAVKNALDTRDREFGPCGARAISPGQRTVTAAFDLYTRDDDATKELYQAARQQSPISVMFQLGEAEGQLMGVYLKSVVPEVPEFDDGENRLQWRFRASRAQGTVDDEISVAFG